MTSFTRRSSASQLIAQGDISGTSCPHLYFLNHGICSCSLSEWRIFCGAFSSYCWIVCDAFFSCYWIARAGIRLRTIRPRVQELYSLYSSWFDVKDEYVMKLPTFWGRCRESVFLEAVVSKPVHKPLDFSFIPTLLQADAAWYDFRPHRTLVEYLIPAALLRFVEPTSALFRTLR